jgi:hypothetical protein
MTAAASQSYIWETEIDRVLNTNGRYRFSVLVPNTWSSDQTQSYLESLGWNVVSIGAPPSDVMQAISGILQETGLPSGSAPSAFWVIATWPNATANLPVSSGQLYYATLDYYAPVSAADVTAVNAETQAPPTNWMPAVLAFAGGALIVGTVLYASKSSTSMHGQLLHNPRQLHDPKTMSAAAINKELDSIDKKRSALNTKFIDAGRGYETPTETHKLSDPLALEYRALADRRFDLSSEVRLRAGPGMDRLPRGFGPRKYAMENPTRNLKPSELAALRYLACVPGGSMPKSKGSETRVMDTLSRGGYILLVGPHGFEITDKGKQEL